MQQQFKIVREVIVNRRTMKPGQMNGQPIDDSLILELLQLADWAPTHGRTEPWRFYVYGTDKVQQFCAAHAELYRTATPEQSFNQGSYDKLKNMGEKASHIIIAVMRRGDLPKIPELEEIAATAASIQNILLGAEAMGLAVYWGSGGMILKDEIKKFLGLREVDRVLGALYLGYTDEPLKAGHRQIALEEKVKWM